MGHISLKTSGLKILTRSEQTFPLFQFQGFGLGLNTQGRLLSTFAQTSTTQEHTYQESSLTFTCRIHIYSDGLGQVAAKVFVLRKPAHYGNFPAGGSKGHFYVCVLIFTVAAQSSGNSVRKDKSSTENIYEG